MPSADYPLTLDEALAALRARQAADPDNFQPGASEEEIQRASASLPIPIPLAWQKMLQVSQEFSIYCWMIHSPSEICMSDEIPVDFLEELPAPQLIIVSVGDGSYLTLNTSELTPEGDCPVLWITGEGDDGRWESVGEFLQAILSQKYSST